MPEATALIAVVDDDARVLASLGALLASAGYDVRLFASGQEFFTSGCVAHIDCLISDIAMPEMDGFEVMRIAREASPALPVMLVSGRSDVLSRSPPGERSHYRLFRKPFDPEELLAAVAHAVRRADPAL